MKKYDGIKYRLCGFYDEETPEQKAEIFNRIEVKNSLTREEAERDLLLKKENGECWVRYKGIDRKGVIMGGSSNGSMTIGIYKDEEF
jgi:hypothetical protein